MAHGVWFKIGPGISFAKELHGCLQEDTQHKWTGKDIGDHLKEHPDNFNPRWNPARDQSRTIQPSPLSVRATTANPPNLQSLTNYYGKTIRQTYQPNVMDR
jgi:hypothetical protein